MATPDWQNVVSYGADPTGANDSTNAIQTAVATAAAGPGGVAYFPAGTYIVTATVVLDGKNGLVVVGDGSFNTVILGSPGIFIFFPTNTGQNPNNSVEISAMTLRSGPGGNSAIHIYSQSANLKLLGVNFDKYNVGLFSLDNLATIRDCQFSNGAPGSGVGIYINGWAGGGVIDNVVMIPPGRNSQPASGIQIRQAGAVLISNSNIIQQGTNLLIQPINTVGAFSVFATNTYFDSAISAVYIQPFSQATVARTLFSNCWFCSHTSPVGAVVLDQGAGGNIYSVSFDNCISCFNSGAGMSVNGGTDVTIRGGIFAQNLYGIYIGSNVSDFTIEGASLGSYSAAGNSQYGIAISPGNSDRYIVVNNRVTGNGIVGVFDAGSGTNKVVNNNIG